MLNHHNFFFRSILFICIISLACFPGCNTPQEKQQPPQPKEVVLYNWKDFTDFSVLEDFKQETGISVRLIEYQTRDMCIAQLQTTPGLCDVMLIDTYNFPYLKTQKIITAFDDSRIPNIKRVKKTVKNLLAKEGISQPPYLSGTNGFVINTRFVPPNTDSWTVFGDMNYQNRIMLLDDLREAVVPLLCMSGLSINENDPLKLFEARKNASLLKSNGVEFGETFTNLENLLTGRKWIVQTYNGDFIYKLRNKNEFKFIFPKDGFIKWYVIFALHSDASHFEPAHALVNFMLRPDIAARNAKTFCYQAPIDGVETYFSPSFTNNSVINPPESSLSRAEIARDMKENTGLFQQLFNRMKQVE